MRKLVGHETEAQVWAIGSAHLLKHRANRVSQHFFRSRVVVESFSNSFVLRRAHRSPKNFGVQPKLVAEVIIHRSDIRARAGAYLSDRSVVVTLFSEDLSGSIEQFGACSIRSDARSHRLRILAI
jgi:hypothetical protein